MADVEIIINEESGDSDEFTDQEFHDDQENAGENSEAELWQDSQTPNEIELSEMYPLEVESPLEAAIEDQAEALEQLAIVETVAALSVEAQLEAINREIMELRNLLTPPPPPPMESSLDSSANGEAETIAEAVTVTTVDSPPPEQASDPAPERPAKKQRKRSMKSLFKKK